MDSSAAGETAGSTTDVPVILASALDDPSLLDPALAGLGETSSTDAAPAVSGTLNADAINAAAEQGAIKHAQQQDAVEQDAFQADNDLVDVTVPGGEGTANVANDDGDLQSKQIKEEKLEETVMNLLCDDLAPAAQVPATTQEAEAEPQDSGSSDLSTEAIEPSVNGNADTSGSARGRSTSAHPDAEQSESRQTITGKGHSASVASSAVPSSSRPQRRSAAAAKADAAKDGPPVSSSSRTSARRSAAKDKETAASEKPPSSSGGTARTRGLAQKAQDKAEKEQEKRRTSSRTKVQRSDSQRSLQDIDIGEEVEDDDAEAQGAEDDGDDVTRCICGVNDDDSSAFMIQCETCKAWQHGPCMGFKLETECPDTYYCEQCRPDLHPKMYGGTSNTARGSTKRGHGRTASSSAKGPPPLSSSTSRPPHSRDRDSSASVPPASATSTAHHRSRASADASVIQSFVDSSVKKGQASPSPSPASPSGGGTPTSVPLAADGKRPMYPPTSHLSAPAQPKRRSTMNSRESAAFDESLMLANANAFKESRLMASSTGSADNKRKRKKKEDSEGLDREDSLTMDAVKEEDEEDLDEQEPDSLRDKNEADQRASSDLPSGKRLKLDPAVNADTATSQSAAETGDATIIEHMDVDEAPEEGAEDSLLLESELAEDGTEGAGQGGSKKRRRRRGPGATAPVRKKTPAKPRSSRPRTALEIATSGAPLTQGKDTEGAPETPATATVASFAEAQGENGAEIPSVLVAAANRSARKRKAMAEDDIPTVLLQAASSTSGRAVSPTASVRTADSSHSSSDKPLAQQTVPPTPVAHAAEASAAGLQRSDSAQNGLSEPVGKDASGRVNLMPPSANAKGKKSAKSQLGADETEDDHDSERAATPAAPFLTPSDPQPVPTVTSGRGGKVSRGRGGGAGTRGGKHSPHKRGGFGGIDGRKGHKDRDDTPGGLDDFLNQPPTWGLPDHLHHLSHLLPSPAPNPLSVPAYVHTPQVSTAPSPTEAAVGPNGMGDASSASSSTSNTTQQLPAPTKHLEPSAKVRFPPRRVSMTEMKKRAKHVLEYLGRVQMDMVERNNRSRALELLSGANGGAAQPNGDGDKTSQSASMMDNLSRQLINFQEKFS